MFVIQIATFEVACFLTSKVTACLFAAMLGCCLLSNLEGQKQSDLQGFAKPSRLLFLTSKVAMDSSTLPMYRPNNPSNLEGQKKSDFQGFARPLDKKKGDVKQTSPLYPHPQIRE